jgi:hypothetical protein
MYRGTGFAALTILASLLRAQPASAAFIQFDLQSTGVVLASGTESLEVGRVDVLRGKVIFDTSRFDTTGGFGTAFGSAEPLLMGISGFGDDAMAYAEFTFGDQLLVPSTRGSARFTGDRQALDWYDGQWNVTTASGFMFVAVEPGAMWNATQSAFEASDDPAADFLLSHSRLAFTWQLLGEGLRIRRQLGVPDPAYQYSVRQVPEPGTAGILAIGLISLALARAIGGRQGELLQQQGKHDERQKRTGAIHGRVS